MIVNIEELVEILKKEKNKTIVFTNGCFDILHIGHVDYLKKAKKLGDILIVGINSDESIKKIKGNKRPILPLNSRMAILDSFKFVNYVIPFDEETPIKIIKKIKPNIHVKGGDYKIEEILEKEEVEKNGGKAIVIPLVYKISTSKIIEKILKLEGKE